MERWLDVLWQYPDHNLRALPKEVLWFGRNSTLGATRGSASETTQHETEPQKERKSLFLYLF